MKQLRNSFPFSVKKKKILKIDHIRIFKNIMVMFNLKSANLDADISCASTTFKQEKLNSFQKEADTSNIY